MTYRRPGRPGRFLLRFKMKWKELAAYIKEMPKEMKNKPVLLYHEGQRVWLKATTLREEEKIYLTTEPCYDDDNDS